MIDHERLRELEEDFGAEELAQVLAAFLEEAAAAVEALRSGWTDADLRRDRLHFLKGCARTIGAMRLGDLCERFEGAPGPGDDGARRIEREFAQVREAIGRDRLRAAG